MVAVQVALSLVLLIVSGLLYRSVQASTTFRTGFDTDRLVVAHFDLRRYGYTSQQSVDFFSNTSSALTATSGVDKVTFAGIIPLGGDHNSTGFTIDGYPYAPGRSSVSIASDSVGPNYFETMGIPIVEGRGFDFNLARNRSDEAVVNTTLARQAWPGQSAVGKTIGIAGGRSLRVVGVARPISYYSPGESPRPYIYVGGASDVPADVYMIVRSTTSANSIVGAVRQATRSIAPKLSARTIRTFSELRADALRPARSLLTVAAVFGILALALTLIGMYGVISYAVTRRTHEFGIYIALGARRSMVLSMVIREGLILAVVGIVAGVGCAIGCTRLLSGLLFGVAPTDPMTFAAIILLMAAAAVIACYLPARRATRVDPIIALRQDG
jgi:predicted permease